MKKEASGQVDSLIFEGMTSLRAVLRSNSREIKRVRFDREKTKKKARELDFIKQMSRERGFELILCERELIDSVATGTSHGGVIFECGDRALPDISYLPSAPPSDGIDGFYVMLDGIEDPYNFGYALRSIYAAGAAGAVLSPRNWMSAAGVVCRASAGASELLPMYVAEPEEAASFLKSIGYTIVCAGIRDSVSVYDCRLTTPLLLIVGGEKRGISSGLLSLADCVVRLDYGRRFSGSLSTASAASILAYEVMRRCKERDAL